MTACHMQGTLKWSTGERYDGEWANGQENGIGIFTWPDGSTFNGFWEHGKKNGAHPAFCSYHLAITARSSGLSSSLISIAQAGPGRGFHLWPHAQLLT